MDRAGELKPKRAWHLLGAFALMLVRAPAVMAKEPAIVTEEFTVPAVDPGIELYVRNKHPRGVKRFTARLTLPRRRSI
jgi:hypothetical protein